MWLNRRPNQSGYRKKIACELIGINLESSVFVISAISIGPNQSQFEAFSSGTEGILY